jgi:periplasmic protein TonB
MVLYKYFILLFLLACKSQLSAQSDCNMFDCKTMYDSVSDRTVYLYVDAMPSFPGGEDSLKAYINLNTKYPSDIDVVGKVYISFIIEPDGQVTNVRILKGLVESFDNEALRVILKMPKWKAGKCEGAAVPVIYIVPIKFTME